MNHILQVEHNSTNTDKDRFRIKDWLLYPGLGCALILVLHFATGLGLGLSAFAILVGWPLVGTLVTADDDLPGGWSNPDGTIPPPWRTAAAWGQLSVGFAISSFVAALDTGLRTGVGAGLRLLGSLPALLLFCFFVAASTDLILDHPSAIRVLGHCVLRRGKGLPPFH